VRVRAIGLGLGSQCPRPLRRWVRVTADRVRARVRVRLRFRVRVRVRVRLAMSHYSCSHLSCSHLSYSHLSCAHPLKLMKLVILRVSRSGLGIELVSRRRGPLTLTLTRAPP
jgi:hypothetical protein